MQYNVNVILSEIILKTSHEILFLWEDIEKNSRISPFFVGGLILNPRKMHWFPPSLLEILTKFSPPF